MALILTTVALVCCVLLSTVQCQSTLCNEKADILFVMDASGSVGIADFQKQLQFAATFVNSFQVGVTQFSVLRFDSNPSIVIDFGEYRDNTALKNAILNIEYTGLGTDTASALRLAREQAFTSKSARKGVPKVVIVSTDGQSNNATETAEEAANLKASNVLVLAIGIGSSYVKQELDAISTFSEDVFEVSDYNQLVTIVYDYTQLVCEEVKQFKCNNKADVVFLLDSSRNVLPYFTQEIGFVSNVSFRFDLLDVRIGAATFGDSILQRVVNLNQFNNPFQLTQALQAAQPHGETTDTDAALKSVISQQLFDPSSGGRPDAAKILIVLTDGGSVSAAQAKITATQLRLSGVHIIAVGVANPNTVELKDLTDQSVQDVVVPTIARTEVVVDRIQTLTAIQECSVPDTAYRNVTDYCRKHTLVNGIHPHPFNCKQFIECTYLKTDVLNCSGVLVFDPIALTCNYPGLVGPCHHTSQLDTTPSSHITAPQATTSAAPCVTGRVDIMYIFDSSDNIGSSYLFRQELSVAANLAENFHLGLDGVLYSGVSYGAGPQHLFDFSTYLEYKPLQEAILNVNYQGGLTNTDVALEHAQNMFSSGNGSRSGFPKLAIVFTNGRSADSAKTVQAAAALKAAGVHVISVAVSNPDLPELQAIASSPSDVFSVDNFDGLLNAVKGFVNNTCQNDITCHGIQYSDVIFVLDSSASISAVDYRGQLNFVVDVTSKFTLGPNDIQFGAIIFSTETVKLFDLKDFKSLGPLNSALLSASHLNSGTDTAKAINFVREQQMFSSAAGGRDNATKVVVILTDGRSNSINDTVAAAQRLKSSGVKFIVVGIGNEVYTEELRELASDQKSLFLVPGFAALDQIRESVTSKVCGSSIGIDHNNPQFSTLCLQYSWADGRHPNPSDCSTYVECQYLTTTLKSCYSGEAYDPILQTCTDKSSAHSCNDSNYFGPTVTTVSVTEATTPGPVLLDITNLCKDFALADGNYPDPSNCERFVECTALNTRNQTCPFGLHFNTGNGVCDDVHIVNCQLNFHYFDKP